MQCKVLPALANAQEVFEDVDFEAILQEHFATQREKLIQYASVLASSDGKDDVKNAERLNDFLLLPQNQMAKQWSDYAIVFLNKENEVRAKLMVNKTAQQFPEIAAFAVAEQARVLALHDHMMVVETQRRTAHITRFLKAFFILLEQEKAEAQALEYDDLISKSRELLEQREASDWVRYKLEGGVQHVLLDEAQDTSPEQWAIVEAICADFFAGEGSTKAERTLFVVGDPKQSIYRFQGAEARYFMGSKLHSMRVQKQRRKHFAASITTFYRSTESVLRVVDGVLAHAKWKSVLGRW